MFRVFVVLALLPACDIVFGIAIVPDAPPDSAPDAAPQQALCSQITMLGDDFESGDLTPLWPTNVNAAEANGVVTLDLTSVTYAAIDSRRYYDIRELDFSVKLEVQGQFGPGDTVTLELFSRRPGYSVRTTLAFDTIAIERVEDSIAFSMGTVPYTADQLYWRIGRHGDKTEFAFSPDGSSWTTAVSYPNLDYVDFVRPTISASRPGGAAGATATIDNVNGGVRSGHACSIATLTDNFDGPQLGLAWLARSGVQQAGTFEQHDGGVDLTFVPDPLGTEVHLAPITVYDLTDHAVVIEIPQMIDTTAGTGQMFEFGVFAPNGDHVDFAINNGSPLQARSFKSGYTMVGSAPYDPVQHRWLRLRSSGHDVFWETSSTGHDFALLGSAINFGDVSNVEILIEISGVATGPGHLVIDNFDLPN